MAKGGDDKIQPIIVKKIKKGGGGHHGGAWKVAYADFVTAMMAFFLLLWLLNVTTEAQKNAISNYFDPTHPKVSESESGAGGVMGGLSISPEGAMVTTVQPPVSMPTPPTLQSTATSMDEQKAGTAETAQKGEEGKEPQKGKIDDKRLEEELKKREEERFKKTKDQIEKAIKDTPELAALAKNLMVDMTPEGLRIQLVDQEGASMFALGSADMYDKTRKLLALVTKAVQSLPNQISVRGHTDGYAYKPGAAYTNWELSSDRANSSRRALLDSGLDVKRIANVVGKADTEHLVKGNPMDPRNRRISIILLRESLTKGDAPSADGSSAPVKAPAPAPAPKTEPKKTETKAPAPPKASEATPAPAPTPGFQKTQGAVQFP